MKFELTFTHLHDEKKIFFSLFITLNIFWLYLYLHVKQDSKVYEADLAKMLVLTASLFTTSTNPLYLQPPLFHWFHNYVFLIWKHTSCIGF